MITSKPSWPLLAAALATALVACEDFADASHREGPPAAVETARALPPPESATQPAVLDQRVRYTGRFDFSSPEGPRFAWSGSAIEARFTGSAIAVRLRQFYAGADDSGKPHQNRFLAFVDKRPAVTVVTPEGAGTYELAKGLPPGEHSLLLYKITEPLVGEAQLLGFVLAPGGSLLPAPALASQRRLEFIGTSIAAGYGNEGADERCAFTAATENEYLAFGALAARELQAAHATLAWSGKGLLRNFDETTTDTVGELYFRTLPARADSTWDLAAEKPDAVVINLGGIDFLGGVPPREPFIAALRALIAAIRKAAPAAHVFATLGPTLSDSWPIGARALTTAREYLGATVTGLQRAGDARVHFLEFPMQEGPRGCRSHPTVKTHRRMADQLVLALRKELNW